MNQTVGLIMSIVYIAIYIALNVYRFKLIDKKRKFNLTNPLYIFVFWGVRALVIAGLTCFMLFTFQEYVMFCYAKMIVLTAILLVISSMELVLVIDDGLGSIILPFNLLGYFIVLIIVAIFPTFPRYIKVDNKVEGETRYPITASDQNVVKGEINGKLFGIHGYAEQDRLIYIYYYVSDDGKEVLYGKSDEKNTKRVFIDEDEKTYIEITTTTEQYYNVEEKERVIYDGSETVETTIYAPLSEYTGISFDAN